MQLLQLNKNPLRNGGNFYILIRNENKCRKNLFANRHYLEACAFIFSQGNDFWLEV